MHLKLMLHSTAHWCVLYYFILDMNRHKSWLDFRKIQVFRRSISIVTFRTNWDKNSKNDPNFEHFDNFFYFTTFLSKYELGRPFLHFFLNCFKKWLAYKLTTVFPCIVSAETSFSLNLKGGKLSKGENNMREETSFL